MMALIEQWCLDRSVTMGPKTFESLIGRLERRDEEQAKDYEEVLASHRRLVRELDVLLNGEEGAAKQASLLDIVGQLRAEGRVVRPDPSGEPVKKSPPFDWADEDIKGQKETWEAAAHYWWRGAQRIQESHAALNAKYVRETSEQAERITELKNELEKSCACDMGDRTGEPLDECEHHSTMRRERDEHLTLLQRIRRATASGQWEKLEGVLPDLKRVCPLAHPTRSPGSEVSL